MPPSVWQYSYNSVHWMARFVAKYSNDCLKERREYSKPNIRKITSANTVAKTNIRRFKDIYLPCLEVISYTYISFMEMAENDVAVLKSSSENYDYIIGN